MVKHIRLLSTTFLFALTLLCSIQMVGCDSSDFQELSRTINSTDTLEAVLYTVDEGATTSIAYNIAVVKRGDKVDRENAVLTMDKVEAPESIHMKWQGQTLLITFNSSRRIFRSEDHYHVGGTMGSVMYKMD